MVTIKVILLGSNNFFAFMKHIAAIITDVETGREFLLNYPFGSYENDDPRAAQPNKAMQLYRRAAGGYCVQVLHLASKRDYDDFIRWINTQRSSFSWMGNNCARAVSDMIDYFFPAVEISTLTLLVRLSCSCSLVAALFAPLDFIFSALLMAREIKTPAYVYAKAEMLAELYPCANYRIPMNIPVIHSPCPDDSVMTLDEWAINYIYRPLRLI